MTEPTDQPRGGLWRSLGPAIIVASVVLGPGSIVASSKVGCAFGYDMVWLLAVAGVLMLSMTALSARLGVTLEGTLCDELARRAGRPVAAITGLTLFLIAACFQFGNNLGVLYAVEPFLQGTALAKSPVFPAIVLVLLNAGILCVLYGFRSLYRPLEIMMKTMVGLMVLGFAANLLFAQPSILEIFGGLVPSLPAETGRSWMPYLVTAADGKRELVDDWLILQALVATTFSVGAAFYHSYLVRQKGWTREHLGRGLFDSVVGVSVLCLISLMIMVTGAAVLHGKVPVGELKNAADVARQLQPAFGGQMATVFFCLGIFAGAFSSFLINAMIGGTVLADGFGRGGSMDQPWPKRFTAVGLLTGMVVAIAVKSYGFKVGTLLIFAQALTVLGNPLLAGAMLWLATRKDLSGERAVPAWMKWLAFAGFVVVLILAVRVAVNLSLKIYLQATTI